MWNRSQLPPPHSLPKTVLVVDDNPMILHFVERVLKSRYGILNAASGAKAIRRANEHPEPIHLLLSDCEMPKMSGIELAAYICRQRPAIRVLLMSEFTSTAIVLNEDWNFLAKPFISSQLREIRCQTNRGPGRTLRSA